MKTKAKAHALFAPSAADRWTVCTKSVLLGKDAPRKDSVWSKEGTDAHECLEEINLAFIAGHSIVKVRERLKKKFPEQMVEDAFMAHLEIVNLMPKKTGVVFEAEKKVDISAFTVPEQFGTADAFIVEKGKRLTVVDFKYGAGVPVDVTENLQMVLYALGFAREHDYDFETVRMVIIQPRAEHKDGTVRTWEISMEELMSYIKLFKTKAAEALDEKKAKYHIGEHCHWCPAAVSCEAKSKMAMEKAAMAFDEPEEGLPVVRSVPIMGKNVSPAALAKAITGGRLVRDWLDALEERAMVLLEEGVEVPGYVLEPKRATRKWADPKKVEKEARKYGKVLFTSPELLTPAQAEVAMEAAGFDGKGWVKKREVRISSGYNLAQATTAKATTTRKGK